MKLIIDNQSSKTELEALVMVQSILMKGKCSFGRLGRQFQKVTIFNGDVFVECRMNKKSYRFLIRDL